jgi:hypothetical protein
MVNYDPANMLRRGVVEGVKTLGPWIVHTHAKDYNPETQKATVGEGLVPWDEYIATLRSIGYDGWYALEDGQWHSLTQIRKELCMSEDDFLKIIDFFKRFNFIDIDEKGEKVKLNTCLLKLPIKIFCDNFFIIIINIFVIQILNFCSFFLTLLFIMTITP